MISGKQGCGKSTLSAELGKLILSDERYWFYAMKFADPLYQMHDAVWSIMQSFGTKKPEKIDGTLMQLLGTEWGRAQLGKNVWVDILRSRVHAILDGPSKWPRHRVFVVDDARFPNEVDCFTRFDLKVIRLRLEAPEHVRKVRAAKWRENTAHASETALDDYQFDKVIFTDAHNISETLNMTMRLIEDATKC